MPKWLTDSATVAALVGLVAVVIKIWGDLKALRAKTHTEDRTADNVALTTVSGALAKSLEANFTGNESYVRLLESVKLYATEVATLRGELATMRAEMDAMKRTLEEQNRQLMDCEKVRADRDRLQRENTDLKDMYNAVMTLVDTVENGKEAVEGAVGAAAKILKRLTARREKEERAADHYGGLED